MTGRFAQKSNANKQVGWLGLAVAVLLTIWAQGCTVDDAESQDAARHAARELLYGAQNDSSRGDDVPKALAQIQLGLRQTRDDPLQYGLWLQPLWLYYLLNDDHAKARDTLEEALGFLAKGNAAPELIADMTVDLSYSLILLGEVAKAKEYLRRGIAIASEGKNRMLVATLYYSLGDAYRKTGERMVSQRYFEAAYEILKDIGVTDKASASEMKVGSLAREAGNLAEAVQRHERVLAQFRNDPSYFELVTRIELARDHAALGNLDLAEEYAQQALDDPRALPEQRIDATVLLLRVVNDRRAAGKAAAADVERAANLVHRIEALIKGSSTRQKSQFARPTHQLQFQEQAIRHYAMDNNLDEVETRGRLAIRLVQQVARDLSSADDDSRAWLASAQPLLNEYLKALYRLNRSEVFPLLEAYYSYPVALSAHRHSGAVERAFERQAVDVFENYRAVQQKVVDATAEAERLRLFGSAEARDSIERLNVEQLLHERDLARDAYLATQAKRPSGTLSDRANLETAAPPAVPATDVLVRYFIQEQVSFGLVLTGAEPEYFDLPPRSTVLKLIRRALEVLERPADGDVDRAPLTALARLMPPGLLARHSGATRLVIVPDDTVQPAPFAAIDIADGAGPYAPLGARFEIVRTKSVARYYASVAKASTARTKADIVIFANPRIDARPAIGLRTASNAAIPRWSQRLPRLPNTSVEAANISQLFDTRVVKSYLGADATNEALLSPDARTAKVLHIATHGYFSNTSPDLVGLATSAMVVAGRRRGGFLGLTELFTQPFASRLVVISGCETMRGQDYSGWGVGSLADGFMTQGAGSVLGMAWSVSDDATARLMSAFYRELSHSNGNSSRALRAAQRELMGSDRYRHPYYWAGAVLVSSNMSVDQHAL